MMYSAQGNYKISAQTQHSTNKQQQPINYFFHTIIAVTTVQNCADGGVLGSVVGVIGTIQANETIKLACMIKHRDIIQKNNNNIDIDSVTNNPFRFKFLSGYLLLFDAMNTDFRKIKLRPQNINCAVCGQQPTITIQHIQSSEYTSKLGDMHDKPVMSCKLGERNTVMDSIISNKRSLVSTIDVLQYSDIVNNRSNTKQPYILIDVRQPVQYAICKLDNSINIPLNQINNHIDYIKQLIQQHNNQQLNNEHKEHEHSAITQTTSKPIIYTLCRRGIDSIHAAELLSKNSDISQYVDSICSIDGGLLAYSQHIDQTFPIY